MSALGDAKVYLSGIQTDGYRYDHPITILARLVAEIEAAPAGEAVPSTEGYPAALNGYTHDDDLAINAFIGKRVWLVGVE